MRETRGEQVREELNYEEMKERKEKKKKLNTDSIKVK